jgi:prenyltransferase beta subunit
MTSLLVSMALAVAAPVPKDDKEDRAFRAKVDAAREKAVKFLKEKQRQDGTWEDNNAALAGMTGGQTALVTLALLDAGVPANDPVVTGAVEYLAGLKPERVYVVSLQIQALALTKDVKRLPTIQNLAEWLIAKAITKGGKLQGWSYPANATADNSNTHFAVMGLHAAARAGAKVDAELWPKVRDYYADTQRADGGWTYHNAGEPQTTASMTTAALLGLAVAAKYDKAAKGPHPALEKGMALLLGGKFDEAKSVGYNLFTTAELGRELGTVEFKAGKLARTWYREGAEKLLKEQQQDGSWKAGEKSFDKNFPVVSTAFGLYSLGPPVKK